MAERFADRFQSIIDAAAGGNYSKLARVAGIPVPTVQRYRQGILPQFAEHLIKISKAFNVNLHWLLTGHGNREAGALEIEQLDETPVIDKKPELLESFFLAMLISIRSVVEFSLCFSNHEHRINFLIELGDKSIRFVHVDLNVSDANHHLLLNRIRFLFLLWKKRYVHENIDSQQYSDLLNSPEEETLRRRFEEAQQRERELDIIDASSSTFDELIARFLWLLNESSAKDLDYLKSAISKQAEFIQVKKQLAALQTSKRSIESGLKKRKEST